MNRAAVLPANVNDALVGSDEIVQHFINVIAEAHAEAIGDTSREALMKLRRFVSRVLRAEVGHSGDWRRLPIAKLDAMTVPVRRMKAHAFALRDIARALRKHR